MKRTRVKLIYNIADLLPVPGRGVRGVLWCVRDCIWGVECDGQHDHLGPLVL